MPAHDRHGGIDIDRGRWRVGTALQVQAWHAPKSAKPARPGHHTTISASSIHHRRRGGRHQFGECSAPTVRLLMVHSLTWHVLGSSWHPAHHTD